MRLNNPSPSSRRSLLNRLLNHSVTTRIIRLANPHAHSLKAQIFFFLLGYEFFVWTYNWTEEVWTRLYWLWDKTNDFLVYAVMYQLAAKSKKILVIPVLIFALLRLLWEAVGLWLKLDAASSMTVNYCMFAVGAVTIIMTYFLTEQDSE